MWLGANLLTMSEGASDPPISWKTLCAINSVCCNSLGHPSLLPSITRDSSPDCFLVELQQYSWEGGSCIARLKPILPSSQESQSRIVWFSTSPGLTCSIFRPWRMTSTSYGGYRDIASRTVNIWHRNITKQFSTTTTDCLLSTGIDKNYI